MATGKPDYYGEKLFPGNFNYDWGSNAAIVVDAVNDLDTYYGNGEILGGFVAAEGSAPAPEECATVLTLDDTQLYYIKYRILDDWYIYYENTGLIYLVFYDPANNIITTGFTPGIRFKESFTLSYYCDQAVINPATVYWQIMYRLQE